MSTISLQGRSVLGLADFTAEEIERILEVAAQMKKIVLSNNKKKDFLKGKSIVTVFSEASTRTRSSFELAGKYLGADVINITKSGSSMTKGESMRDTLLTVSAIPFCIHDAPTIPIACAFGTSNGISGRIIGFAGRGQAFILLK